MTAVKSRTKTTVRNLTRNDLVRGTAERFLEMAEDKGGNCSFYRDRLEVMISMKLVEKFHLVVYQDEHPISGMALRFDWERHEALIEAEGEFFDPDKIDQYGTVGSVTETIEALRTYIDGLFHDGGATRIDIWYTVSRARKAELGEARVNELLGVKPTPDGEKANQAEWSKICKARFERPARRSTTLGELPETSFDIW